MKRSYQMCKRTVMDTTDPEIWFDEKGISNYVYYFENEVKLRWFPDEEGKRRLLRIVERIKNENSLDTYHHCFVIGIHACCGTIF